MKECYLKFINNEKIVLTDDEKKSMVNKFITIDENIECVHKEEELLTFIECLLTNKPEGVIAEAGCYKGGGSAKISLLSEAINKKMYVFDSFEGLPEHNENHEKNIYGKDVTFVKGEYSSAYDQTVSNVKKYGSEKICTFVKGWFKDTFGDFHEPLAGAYIDVDLVESVRECVTKFYPLLSKNGVLCCHDGHLPLVIELLDSNDFWENQVGCSKPFIEGLGTEKLIKIIKE